MEFSEFEACHVAGLDMVKWMRGDYSIAEKVTILAWYRGHNTISEHSHDAATSKS